MNITFVIVGGAIGIIGSLLASLLNSRLSERRFKNEQYQKFREHLGKRQAMHDRANIDLNLQITNQQKYDTPCFQASSLSLSELGYLIGYIEESNTHLNQTFSETLELKKEIATSQQETQRLQNDNACLEAEHARLLAQKAELSSQLELLSSKKGKHS